MKKKTIELSRWQVAAFVLLGIGMLFLLGGILALAKFRAALNLSRLDTENLRSGKYVKGEIRQYAGKNSELVDVFFGVSGSYGYGFTFYDAYTIPAEDGKFVEILIKDEALLDQLEAYDRGIGSGAFFVGRVEKPRYEYNYDFWKDSSVFAGVDDAKARICNKYVIRQTHPEGIRYRIYVGLSLVLTAWIIIKGCGGVKVTSAD